MTDSVGMTVRVNAPFDTAVLRTREALKAEGFGVLTEIDLRSTFKDKLGQDFRPFVILGACNPQLAFSAMSADPEVGLLLPCNVTVEAVSDGESVVRLVDPVRLLSQSALGGSPMASEVANDARERLARVARALAG